ncbi:MAG: hypothetical protein INQ03_12555 [Candidatus Heimdallarchaeota archaeon]|nr:hypothetical protein [Candidatus Heimdallarchaeota archaeon]
MSWYLHPYQDAAEKGSLEMKILIIHNSAFGNGITLAKTIAAEFDTEEVLIHHNGEISPFDAIVWNPDLLIMGTAVRVFRINRQSKKWIDTLNKILKEKGKKIPFGACFITHALSTEKHMKKGHNFLSKLEKGEFEEVWPEWITGKVISQDGPFEEGVLDYVSGKAKEMISWIQY